jgi:hypothetical protein
MVRVYPEAMVRLRPAAIRRVTFSGMVRSEFRVTAAALTDASVPQSTRSLWSSWLKPVGAELLQAVPMNTTY